jgi:hypothetical protein
MRCYLRLMRSGYRRTASTLKHKQDPAKAALAKKVLTNLRDRAEAGQLELHYLDECGFAPSLPTGHSWCLPGQRNRVRYEYPAQTQHSCHGPQGDRIPCLECSYA